MIQATKPPPKDITWSGHGLHGPKLNEAQRQRIREIVAKHQEGEDKDNDKLMMEISLLGPSQLIELNKSAPALLTQLESASNSNSPNLEFVRYHREIASTGGSMLHKITAMMKQQIEYITGELINNSYPTPAIIARCYCAITNAIYLVEADGLFPQDERVLKKIATAVDKHAWAFLTQQGQHQRGQGRVFQDQERVLLMAKLITPPSQTQEVEVNVQSIDCAHACRLVKYARLTGRQVDINKKRDISIAILNGTCPICSYANIHKLHYNRLIASPLSTQIGNTYVWCHKLSILLELGKVYPNVMERVCGYVMTIFDAVETQEKITVGQVRHSYDSAPTVASMSTLLSLSPVKLSENAPPILKQLLSGKSSIIFTAFGLLCKPHASVKAYLNPLHSWSVPSIIHSLYQHQSTAIKYSEILEHNPTGKQPVFDSDIYRNHGPMYLYLECMKVFLGAVQEIPQLSPAIAQEICQYAIKSVRQIIKTQSKTTHNSAQFYSILNIWKFIYIISYYPQIKNCWVKLAQNKEHCLMSLLLETASGGSIHPLVRQYLSLILAKLYLGATGGQVQKKWRGLLLEQIQDSDKININVYVPVILTLGHEMVEQATCPQQPTSNQQTFDIFMKYISCHNAYIRSITQYYIRKVVQLRPSKLAKDSFLYNLCHNVWTNDKDCVKIMKNIGIAVEGFREAMASNQALEFLTYERVEESPSEVVLRQMRQDLAIVLAHFYKQLTAGDEWTVSIKKHIGLKLQKLDQLVETSPTKNRLVIHYKPPQIIIIATLLEKVHNFGYILRTLHGKRAMLVVPSKQPLEHPECKQFIPANSQVEVIEIKQKQLQKFIILKKKMGYPMIGLEQCAGSVKIEQYKFPSQYMLLLGNERIGAPASLLNLADALVEIPQVGKVRSLNVHVSMAICYWQSIINNGSPH